MDPYLFYKAKHLVHVRLCIFCYIFFNKQVLILRTYLGTSFKWLWHLQVQFCQFLPSSKKRIRLVTHRHWGTKLFLGCLQLQNGLFHTLSFLLLCSCNMSFTSKLFQLFFDWYTLHYTLFNELHTSTVNCGEQKHLISSGLFLLLSKKDYKEAFFKLW